MPVTILPSGWSVGSAMSILLRQSAVSSISSHSSGPGTLRWSMTKVRQPVSNLSAPFAGSEEAFRRPEAQQRDRQSRPQHQQQHQQQRETAGNQAEQARQAAAAALADSAASAAAAASDAAHRKADRGPARGPAAGKDWLADNRPSGKVSTGNKDWLADEGGSNDSEGVRRRGTAQSSGPGVVP